MNCKMVLVLITIIVAVVLVVTGCPQPKNTTSSVTTTEMPSTSWSPPTLTVSYDFGEGGWVE